MQKKIFYLSAVLFILFAGPITSFAGLCTATNNECGCSVCGVGITRDCLRSEKCVFDLKRGGYVCEQPDDNSCPSGGSTVECTTYDTTNCPQSDCFVSRGACCNCPPSTEDPKDACTSYWGDQTACIENPCGIKTCGWDSITGSTGTCLSCAEVCKNIDNFLNSPTSAANTGHLGDCDQNPCCSKKLENGKERCVLASEAGGSKTSSEGGLEKTVCTCSCQTVKICAFGLAPKSGIFGDPGKIQSQKQCDNQCARACGGYALYNDNCAGNCEVYCVTKYPDGASDASKKTECVASCKSACDFRKMIQSLIDMIYMLSGIIGAVMIIIHAIRIAVASDPHEREDAKKSIFFVLLALAVIALAGTFVALFSGIVGNSNTPVACGFIISASGGRLFSGWRVQSRQR